MLLPLMPSQLKMPAGLWGLCGGLLPASSAGGAREGWDQGWSRARGCAGGQGRSRWAAGAAGVLGVGDGAALGAGAGAA